MASKSRIALLMKRVKNPAFALHAGGTLLAARARRAFAEQGKGGKPWVARSVPNVLGIISDLEAGRDPPPRRFDARPALEDTGRLQGSIRYRVVSNNSIELVAATPYASTHEHGGTVTKRIGPDVVKGLARLLKRRPELRVSLGWLFSYAKAGKPITVRIPERPYLRPTPKDISDATGAVLRTLLARG